MVNFGQQIIGDNQYNAQQRSNPIKPGNILAEGYQTKLRIIAVRIHNLQENKYLLPQFHLLPRCSDQNCAVCTLINK